MYLASAIFMGLAALLVTAIFHNLAYPLTFGAVVFWTLAGAVIGVLVYSYGEKRREWEVAIESDIAFLVEKSKAGK